MLPPSDKYCPWWRKPMSKVCLTCPMWVNVRGKHPQTGVEVDQWNCSFSWLPMIQVEAIKTATEGAAGVQAAVESFRNEIHRQQSAMLTGSPRIVRSLPIAQDVKQLTSD